MSLYPCSSSVDLVHSKYLVPAFFSSNHLAGIIINDELYLSQLVDVVLFVRQEVARRCLVSFVICSTFEESSSNLLVPATHATRRISQYHSSTFGKSSLATNCNIIEEKRGNKRLVGLGVSYGNGILASYVRGSEISSNRKIFLQHIVCIVTV
jgi:hypothetical protein